MGYAASRVRYFRFQYNRYYDKYSQIYTDYKKVKAELDKFKKIEPDGGRGGWFRGEEIEGGMGIHPDNIRNE